MLLLVLSIFSLAFFCSKSYAANLNFSDYSSINVIDTKYSYGTLFYTENTSFIPLQYTAINQNPVTNFADIKAMYGANSKGTIKIKITNCAVDESGDLCDVICTINIIKLFSQIDVSKQQQSMKFFPSYKDTKNPIISYLSIRNNFSLNSKKISSQNVGDLIILNLNVQYAKAQFTLEYYKTGTNNKANIKGTNALIFDIDYGSEYKNTLTKNEFFSGQEAVRPLYDSNIYYDKSSNGYLQNINSSVGVSKTKFKNPWDSMTDGISKKTSCFVTQSKEASFQMYYGGSACGIQFAFVSPYKYKLPSPSLTVNKDLVYEDESYTCSVSQYIPNNYYGSLVPFLENNTLAPKFIIKKSIVDREVLNYSVTNETGKNVTDYFNIVITDTEIQAILKEEYLSNPIFYSHMYNLNVEEKCNIDYGLTHENIVEEGYSVIEEQNSTNQLSVNLKYDVNTTASIDNGSVSNDSNKNAVKLGSNDNYTVIFTVNDNYLISKVLVNGKEISVDNLTFENGKYLYTFENINIRQNINQSINIETVLKTGTVKVHYVDMLTNKEIITSDLITKNVGESFNIDIKNIDNYTYINSSENTSGVIIDGEIDVYHYYLPTVSFSLTTVAKENIENTLENCNYNLYKCVCKNDSHNHTDDMIDINDLSPCFELVSTYITDKDGKIFINNLEYLSKYWLVETKTAKNRLLPDGQWKINFLNKERGVDFEKDGIGIKIEKINNAPEVIITKEKELLIPNVKVYTLPVTGSKTEEIFYAGGLVLIVVGNIILLNIERKIKI